MGMPTYTAWIPLLSHFGGFLWGHYVIHSDKWFDVWGECTLFVTFIYSYNQIVRYKNDESCINNRERCIKNKELCIKNKELQGISFKNDEFCRTARRTTGRSLQQCDFSLFFTVFHCFSLFFSIILSLFPSLLSLFPSPFSIILSLCPSSSLRRVWLWCGRSVLGCSSAGESSSVGLTGVSRSSLRAALLTMSLAGSARALGSSCKEWRSGWCITARPLRPRHP